MYFYAIIAWTCVLCFKLIVKFGRVLFSSLKKKSQRRGGQENIQTFPFTHKIFSILEGSFNFFMCFSYSCFYYLPPHIVKKINDILGSSQYFCNNCQYTCSLKDQRMICVYQNPAFQIPNPRIESNSHLDRFGIQLLVLCLIAQWSLATFFTSSVSLFNKMEMIIFN